VAAKHQVDGLLQHYRQRLPLELQLRLPADSHSRACIAGVKMLTCVNGLSIRRGVYYCYECATCVCVSLVWA
jgi:hypothetical protein